ncbi:hypothetical protein GAYE_PCTG69G1467 [Galdieria yellowstonensis]|uniref:BZIP domain-containing protein n=1 Tax=Galdieria yellowstonensis TaxID=3028027 RepID=A0AAV9I8E3_9RHOD|nr:hypothetical protein GAYE_PCTG69G1467 [Galdieria yellowstonensis]
MENPERKKDEEEPSKVPSSEQEKLPSFRNLMAEIHRTFEASAPQEIRGTQRASVVQVQKRPRVEAPLYIETPYEISPVSPFPGLRTTEYASQSTEYSGTRETTQETGEPFKEEASFFPEANIWKQSVIAAKEARRHRKHILQVKAKGGGTAGTSRLRRAQRKMVSSEQLSPPRSAEVGSIRTSTASSETSTSRETEEVAEQEAISHTAIRQVGSEERKSIESEAGPSSAAFPKRGRGRKREHPEWTEEERQAERIRKNREAAERARQKRKEKEESLLRELTSAIERNRLLEEEIQRLREQLKEVLPSSSGKDSQEHHTEHIS